MMNTVVEMRGIEKSFGQNYVLKKVDFTLAEGSIHALLGENGTGKTTLMNVLGSILPKDSGSVSVNGLSIDDLREKEQFKQQIAFIHQELSLVNDLSVYENLFLGRELKQGFFLDKKRMIEETQQYINQLEIELDPETLVRDLNPAFKQITEILRALMQQARVIIMDEPTTSLTDVEINHIFDIMNTLKKQGVSLIFISHKLNEVLRICDTYTIMRDGLMVATGSVDETTTEAFLSRHMVGRELATNEVYERRPVGEVILELKNLSKERQFKEVSLNLRRGEIVGVTGLLGDGRSEVFAAVAGANYPYKGDIRINGQSVKFRNTAQAKRHHIAYVPKNRKENGIIKDLSIANNATLPILQQLTQYQLIHPRRMAEKVDEFVSKLNIRLTDAHDKITALSGGNQQKVVLAKALGTDPQVVILDNPTQGVDVGAKAEIYQLILQLASEGISFIILSNEISEIQKLCDRVYVMFHGEVKHEFQHEELNEADVMLVATGGTL